jgi:tetratricopeptide (TPR) repeat protein
LRSSVDSTELASPATGRLDSWKEIAAFFGKDVRTVRRWEAERGLPVHRVPGGRSGRNNSSIYAYASELQAWLLETGTSAESVDVEAALPQAAVGSPQDDLAGTDHTATLAELSPAAKPVPRWTLPLIAAVLLLIATSAIWVRHRQHLAQAAAAVQHAATNPQAQDFYLRGRYLWDLRTEDSLTRAADLFTQAIVHDPRYAPAYAGLADCYLLLRQYGHMTEADAFQRAYTASRQAIALDPTSAEAHRSYAFVLNFWLWNFPAADAEFRRAIELDPNDAQSHHWYATTLFSVGRYPEALQQIDIARKLRPDSVAILVNRGLLLDRIDRSAALATLLEIEQANPGLPYVHRFIAGIRLELKQYPEFLRESRLNASLLNHASQVAVIDHASAELASHGERAMFVALATGYAGLANQDVGQPAMDTATNYARLRDAPHALRFLSLAAQRRESDFHSLPMIREFKFLADNPAYEDLLKRSQTPIAPPAN